MKRDIEIESIVSTALDKVCKAMTKSKENYSECVPQIPDAYIPGEDVAVLGRCLDGALEGKTIGVLATEDNNFAKAVELLLTPIYGNGWDMHVIYGNIALIADVDGGKKMSDRISKTIFNAQYEEICEVQKVLMSRYRPRITFLLTGNTASKSILDWIDFNEPIFQIYKTIGFQELDHQTWGNRKDGTSYTVTLFRANNGSFFLELESPGRISNAKHAEAILELLRRNHVI